MEISFGGVGMKTYEIHSLTVSYFEAGVPLLCFYHFRNQTDAGYRILEWFEENRDFVLDEDSDEMLGTQMMDWLNSRRSSISDIASLMKETGLLSHDKVKRVRTDRHQFLHSPLQMLYLSEWEDINTKADRCVRVADDLDDRLFEDLELHAVYDVLTDKDRTRSRF